MTQGIFYGVPPQVSQAIQPEQAVPEVRVQFETNQTFNDALERAFDAQGVNRPARVDAPGEVPLTGDVPVSADARQRAVDALQLDRTVGAETVGPVGPGQSILDGLQRLRGVFDGQLGEMSARVEGARMDVGDMVALQAEVVKYTLMVDVTSKLAGKSTQAVDSLMKGQ